MGQGTEHMAGIFRDNVRLGHVLWPFHCLYQSQALEGLRCTAVHCSALQCMQCSAVHFSAVHFSAVQTFIILVQCYSITAVWSKGMCMMGQFNCIPNCVAILPVLCSGYQTLTIFEMFNRGHLRVIPSIKNLNVLQAPY